MFFPLLFFLALKELKKVMEKHWRKNTNNTNVELVVFLYYTENVFFKKYLIVLLPFSSLVWIKELIILFWDYISNHWQKFIFGLVIIISDNNFDFPLYRELIACYSTSIYHDYSNYIPAFVLKNQSI